MIDYIIYIDQGKSGLGYEPFTASFQATLDTAKAITANLGCALNNHRFALWEKGGNVWMFITE